MLLRIMDVVVEIGQLTKTGIRLFPHHHMVTLFTGITIASLGGTFR